MLQKLFRINIVLLVSFVFFIIACNEKNDNRSQKYENTLNVTKKNTFLFLTEWFNKVGVYKYDLEKKKYKPVWWHPRENVVMLVYKPGENPAYFFTSEKIGTTGNFPSFSNLKLFIISHDLSETKQIDNIGDGIQFTANWNEDDNLEVIYTDVDKTKASYVNQFTKVFDHYGKLIDSGIRTFDIQKNGFPELVPPRNSTISPSGKFGVSFKSDSVFLKTSVSDSLKFISVLKHKLNKLRWSDDDSYLFISTLDIGNETVKTNNPETSELLIYSLTADSLIGLFRGAGIKNFFPLNDLLIFDDGFNNNSVINIFGLNQKKIIDVVKPKTGCGLVIFPQL
jgi:hypothetical protein